MRLTPALKFQLNSIKWPVIIYYSVIVALTVLLGVIDLVLGNTGIRGTISGLDAASIIFLFVVGLNAYKQTFHLFAANGVSRKTMFKSFAATAGIVCAGMALIDGAYALVFRQFVNYAPTWMMSFADRYADGGWLMYAEGLLWMFFSYLSCIMFGYFITTAYYRMSKALKIAVSVGLPILVLIVLPIVDATLFSGAIFNAFGTIAAFCSGEMSNSPYVAMASDLVFAALYGLLAFLLARRATVKLS